MGGIGRIFEIPNLKDRDLLKCGSVSIISDTLIALFTTEYALRELWQLEQRLQSRVQALRKAAETEHNWGQLNEAEVQLSKAQAKFQGKNTRFTKRNAALRRL
ncbi:hypothetical protein N7492_007371 [Penicillium capsulatum]|uniref:Uncharacterized protein n=1 Tax=Penicillium capsulatum TaxID=69766 RepID=A0A9W9I163_9EURO|nr:hypothetical protein N7492_007371 [Penicillium capsulatum]KAJ6117211.1 hypothetical protein N7512_006936 [Penicillium capsulatum]